MKLLRSSRRFIYWIVVLIAITDISIALNIAILRQILGLIMLTLVPGAVILYIIGLDNLGLEEKTVLSVGLSCSSLMFLGLFVNFLYPLVGFESPLSSSSLFITINGVLLALLIIAYFKRRDTHSPGSCDLLSRFKLNQKEKALLILPTLFPALSVYGMYIMNATDNNIILMALIFIISAFIVILAIVHRHIPERLFPALIFLISISLVLIMALRSNHIIGADAHAEFYIFQLAYALGRWEPFTRSSLDACLSITILPAIYQSFLNINMEYLFKLLYPILFSFSPLAIYIISKRYLSGINSFLASFFFISQQTFLWATYNPRTTIAILFFSLALMVIFLEGLSPANMRFLFIVFASSCIISHYSTTYIFFIILIIVWLETTILSSVFGNWWIKAISPYRIHSSSPKERIQKGTLTWPEKSITLALLGVIFAFMFFWYYQVNGSTFNQGLEAVSNIISHLSNLFVLNSRGSQVAEAFGEGIEKKVISQQVSLLFSWLTIALIAIGVLITLARYLCSLVTSSQDGIYFDSSKGRLGEDLIAFSATCSTLLVTSVALPYVLEVYSWDRTYCQTAVILSIFFVVGGSYISRLFKNRCGLIVTMAILIPYFMCTTGVVSQISDYPASPALSSNGKLYDLLFVHDEDSIAAKWLGDVADLKNNTIYTDFAGDNYLNSQGCVSYLSMDDVTLLDVDTDPHGYVYLRYQNVVKNCLLFRKGRPCDMSYVRPKLSKKGKIYDNRGSEVWK